MLLAIPKSWLAHSAPPSLYLSLSLSLAPSLWTSSIGKSTKIFTPHTRAPWANFACSSALGTTATPPACPAQLSDVHLPAFYWACTTTMRVCMGRGEGPAYCPREVKTLCTHIDCLTEFYLCCWSVRSFSSVRFGSVYYNTVFYVNSYL